MSSTDFLIISKNIKNILTILKIKKNILTIQNTKNANNLVVDGDAGSGNWVQLYTLLQSTEAALQQGRAPPYALQLLGKAVLPYIEKMIERVVLEPKRFKQIDNIIHILLLREYPHHLSVNLLELDVICKDILSEGGFWRSEFGTLLQASLQDAWRPVLLYMRGKCMDIGSKLFMIGLVDSIGRPLMMLYPLYLTTHQVLKLLQNVNIGANLERLERTDRNENILITILQLIKALCLLFAVSKILIIFEYMTSIGTSCLFFGIILNVLPFSEELLKRSTPLIVPQFAAVDNIIEKLNYGEHFISDWYKINDNNASNTLKESNRVEVISPTNEDIVENNDRYIGLTSRRLHERDQSNNIETKKTK
jgi:hypothetical protein